MVRALPPELPPLPEQVVELCAAGGMVVVAIAIIALSCAAIAVVRRTVQ